MDTPDPAAAIHQAVALLRAGRGPEAAALAARLLAGQPADAGLAHLAGTAAAATGDQGGAAGLIRRALALQPRYGAAWSTLGLTLSAAGEHGPAAAAHRRALALRPEAAGWRNLAAALQWIDRPAAADALAEASRLCPADPGLQADLALALQAAGRHPQAIAAAQAALGQTAAQAALGQTAAQATLRLVAGRSLAALGRVDEARAEMLAVLAGHPDHAEACFEMGQLAKWWGDSDEARRWLVAAYALQPIPMIEGVVSCGRYVADANAPMLAALHRRYWALSAPRFEHRQSPGPAGHAGHDGPAGRRLRVGYLSPDLCGHPVGHLLADVLPHHHPAGIEAFCYSSTLTEDLLSERLRAAVPHWRRVAGMSDAALAAAIAADGIDILVELAGLTTGTRLAVLARRPAPIQVSWLGYPCTTGLDSVDYLIADGVVLPEGEEPCYSEEVARLPVPWWCYAPPAYAEPLAAPPPVERTGRVTFGCLNKPAKITPQVIATWAELLRRVPESRLIMMRGELGLPAIQRHYRDLFAAAGIAPGRLEMRGAPLDHGRQLLAYGDIDVALDPFPFCGGMTTCEALWMGVPVVTLAGATMSGRQSASLLRAVGLGDLVAHDRAGYLDIAAALAGDRARLAGLRTGGLRDRMRASPLCDGPAFTRRLEALYRRLWQAWRAGRPERPPVTGPRPHLLLRVGRTEHDDGEHDDGTPPPGFDPATWTALEIDHDPWTEPDAVRAATARLADGAVDGIHCRGSVAAPLLGECARLLSRTGFLLLRCPEGSEPAPDLMAAAGFAAAFARRVQGQTWLSALRT